MSEQKKNQNQRPNISLLSAYGTVKEKMNAYLQHCLEQFPIPNFMVEGIVAGMLADVRSGLLAEMSGEKDAFEVKIEEYYEKQIEEIRSQYEQEKADLIRQFEESGEAVVEEKPTTEEVQ
jgi:hypothetical protein